MEPVHLCGVCNLNVKQYSRRPQLILCSSSHGCRVTIHRECLASPISNHEYVRMKKANEDFGFICPKCADIQPIETVAIPVVFFFTFL